MVALEMIEGIVLLKPLMVDMRYLGIKTARMVMFHPIMVTETFG